MARHTRAHRALARTVGCLAKPPGTPHAAMARCCALGAYAPSRTKHDRRLIAKRGFVVEWVDLAPGDGLRLEPGLPCGQRAATRKAKLPRQVAEKRLFGVKPKPVDVAQRRMRSPIELRGQWPTKHIRNMPSLQRPNWFVRRDFRAAKAAPCRVRDATRNLQLASLPASSLALLCCAEPGDTQHDEPF